MKLKPSVFLFFAFALFACSVQEKIYIVTGGDEALTIAAGDLTRYLTATYPGEKFEMVSQEVSESRNIFLVLEDDPGWANDEAFLITGNDNSLVIKGKTPRAVAYGVHGLLKHLGWNFYLSFQVPPDNPKTLDFASINMQNEPLKEKRILFNWHNFISGCTGWDYQHWKEWIDNGLKIGFNTVMVHAYGNNPMHSFSFNGESKDIGYLTTTLKGRDWGAQHVNDVRLMHGGDLFDHYEFGSEAAKVPDDERVLAATMLMQRVFRHAADKNMDVCFALDVDTWMANPQNIINTLPAEALIAIGGYNTVNPEHPGGRAYYKAQLSKLLSDYPEITMLAPWMRTPRKVPGLGSIWLLHDSSTLPEVWRKEYFEILDRHPGLEDEVPYAAIFAVSKIITAFREILDEIRPDIELYLGSWRLYFPREADPFIPEYCGFIPLDWEIVLDQPEVLQELEAVGKNRKLIPVVWAHHDDHRYIGRPYQPFEEFNRMLTRINSAGYGIIHWTTHPLDLLFNHYEDQVWKNSEDKPFDEAIAGFASSLMKQEDETLHLYFKQWYHEAPMFARETSDYFLRLNQDYNQDGYGSSEEVIKKAEQRLELLKGVNVKALNRKGEREYLYQMGMEKFIISFFTCHQYGHAAFIDLQQGNRNEAAELIRKVRPVETVRKFAKMIGEYGATRGEEGLLISLNLRWLPDYIDLEQRVGLTPVRINFQPASHDPLAQGMGNHTFFIDRKGDFWLSLGEKELNINAETAGNLPMKKVTESWLNVTENDRIPLKTMRGFDLPAAEYSVRLIFTDDNPKCTAEISESGKQIAVFPVSGQGVAVSGRFKTGGEKVEIRLIPESGIAKLAGLIVEAH